MLDREETQCVFGSMQITSIFQVISLITYNIITLLLSTYSYGGKLMKYNKIIAGALSVALICGTSCALPSEGNVDTTFTSNASGSGTCGEKVTWTLKDDTLTISGTGPMTDFDSEMEALKSGGTKSPFKRYHEIEKIVIEEGVTTIGSRAFEDCQKLSEVTIPDGVISIGDEAFCDCPSISSLTLPDSVTSIGSWAFENSGLQAIVLPDGLTSIGKGAFYLSALESITLPDSVTSIDEAAFSSTFLTSITIPDSVTRISCDTFSYCSKLTSVTLPYSVTSIGEQAFLRCTSLTSFTVPSGVESIGERAFYGCLDLREIRGYTGSCAEACAKEYDIPFVAIDNTASAPVTTIVSTTATTKPTTTTTVSTKTAESSTITVATTTVTETTTVTTVPEKPDVSFGDPTGDGKIDAKDASFVLVEYAKLSTGGESELSDAEKSAADVNKDGKTDSKDASSILIYYAYVSTGGTDSIESYLGYGETPVTKTSK